METKYYKPEIEEFYVGFEYESLERIRDNSGNKEWYKAIMRNSPSEFKRLSDNYFPDIFFDDIRVKYLDRKDIESFGFNCKEPYVWQYNNDRYLLTTAIHTKNEIIPKEQIVIIDKMNDEVIFRGFIKNISELKRLLIQLDII